jgi:hydroxyacylglutathione hydrolase
MDISRDEGMKFTHIIETHLHADIINTNSHGAPLLERCPMEQTLNPDQFENILRQGATLIDTRDTADFGGFHIPGAINIGFEKQMANWIFGYLSGGISAWISHGMPIESLSPISAQDMKQRLDNGDVLWMCELRMSSHRALLLTQSMCL